MLDRKFFSISNLSKPKEWLGYYKEIDPIPKLLTHLLK